MKKVVRFIFNVIPRIVAPAIYLVVWAYDDNPPFGAAILATFITIAQWLAIAIYFLSNTLTH